MPDFEHCEQRSPEWLALRRGVITASNAHRLLTPAKRKTYALELASEILMQEMPEQPVTFAMQWGLDHEPVARARYEFETDATVDTCGFAWLDHFHGQVGCSPDGLIGKKGAIEIKCPQPKGHVEHLMNGPTAEYMAQIQFQIWVLNVEWNDFVSFHPGFDAPNDFYLQRIERNSEQITALQNGADDVLNQIAVIMSKIRGE